MKVVKRVKGLLQGNNLATLVLLLGQLSAALGAVAVNILAARVLSPADRGDLAFGLQIAYFLTVFATMGLERPYIALREGTFNSEYKHFTKLVLPGVVVIVPIGLVAVYFSPLGGAWIGYGAIAIAAYTAFNTVARGVRVGYVTSRDWRKFGVNAIASQFVIFIGAVILVALGVDNPIIWMFVYTASTFPALLLLVRAFNDRSGSKSISTKERTRLRRRGLVLFASDFSNTAMLRSDKLLLPILASPAELGLYVTVATVLEMASWPIKQWVDASLRGWSNSKDQLAAIAKKVLLKSCLMLIFTSIVLGLAAYLMISWFLPDSYMPAVSAIVPLAVGSVIFGLTRVQQGFLIALGASAGVSIVEVVGIVSSVLAYLVLIPEYGMLGAAYGSIIGYFVCYVIGAFILTRLKKKAV